MLFTRGVTAFVFVVYCHGADFTIWCTKSHSWCVSPGAAVLVVLVYVLFYLVFYFYNKR